MPAVPPKGVRFGAGQRQNPGGRPKALVAVQDLARQHTPEAIMALVEALKVKGERVPAAAVLLDRAWGKVPQAITGADGGALGITIQVVTGVARDEPEQIEAEAEAEEIGHYQIDAD